MSDVLLAIASLSAIVLSMRVGYGLYKLQIRMNSLQQDAESDYRSLRYMIDCKNNTKGGPRNATHHNANNNHSIV